VLAGSVADWVRAAEQSDEVTVVRAQLSHPQVRVILSVLDVFIQ
jgi:hypothetical protein